MKEKICGIYKITCLVNNKVYVGQSIDIFHRWKRHIKSKGNSLLYKDIISFGLENFKFEILKECLLEDLNDLECFFIRVNHSWKRQYGYNKTLGGSPGIPTEETKQKVSNRLKGHKLSKETKLKISKALMGHFESEETKKKKSDFQKGRSRWNKGITNISYYNSKPIICITTGETFPSKKETRRKTGITKPVLNRILSGRILETDKLIYKYIYRRNE